MIDKKDASKFVEELARLDEQFTDDLIAIKSVIFSLPFFVFLYREN